MILVALFNGLKLILKLCSLSESMQSLKLFSKLSLAIWTWLSVLACLQNPVHTKISFQKFLSRRPCTSECVADLVDVLSAVCI